MGNISLALCIPTYERRDMVEDFLVNCSAYYIKAGIDIYYYDSSVSDETEKLVCGWPDQEHVHYIKIPPELLANAKAYRIFQKYGLKKEYDFIWLSNDGLQCTRQAIQQIVDSLNLEYDIIEVNSTDSGNVGTRTFTDSNEYMQSCAWHLGLFGAAILNGHTMLEGVDWAYYESRFLVPLLVPFSHVSFYFYRILELDKFCAFHLSLSQRSIKSSKLKKTIGWLDSFFYNICECWIETIDTLPDYYTNKERAMVTLGDLSLIKSMTVFYRFRERGIYSLNLFLKYRSVWNRVTSLSQKKLFLAAITPRVCIRVYYKLRKAIGRKKLQKFCTSHKRIFIYGTGIVGDVYAQYFDTYGLDYEAFCVSCRKDGQQEHLSRPVYGFAELKYGLDGAGFVVAMAEHNVAEVLPSLCEAVGDDAVFSDLKLSEDIRHEFGYIWP